MSLIETYLASLIPWLDQYSILITFLAGAFGGDGIILILSFLAAQGVLSLHVLLIFSYIGTVLSDLAWFWVSRSNLPRKLKFLKKLENPYKNVEAHLNRLEGNRPFQFLLIAKFLYGTKIITLIYLGAKKMKLVKFLIYDLLSTAIWLVSIVALGWLAGKGVGKLVEIYQNVQIGITLFVVIIIIFYLIAKFVNRKLSGKAS